MDPELLPRIPDLSWAEPLAHEAVNMLRDALASAQAQIPTLYWTGYQNGWVHATLALLATWCLSRK